MKILAMLFLALGLIAARPPAARAESLKDKVVGTWLETGKSDNLVTLNADGTYKIFLKKGEIGNLHFLEGTWTLTPDMIITVSITVQGQTKSVTAKVSFEGEEMIFTDKDTVTRQRRVKGAVPERFVW
jgi:hypothetical protein